ncbi:lipocalin family protein [Chryseobacterium joostei]|uniref:lipocalin family protein n=1 Tax=Chryseobacterium joostei TaxID=112234 RepID=UPI0023F38B3A|nr:lipocalin family protein [Chryseobacterium joostei]
MIKKVLFLSIATLYMSSCNSDNDTTAQINEPSIVGKWQPSKYMAYSGKDGSIITNESSDAGVCDKKGFLDLSANGKMHEIAYYGNTDAECKIDFDTTSDYTYDASSKKIQVKYSNGTSEVYTIKRVTATELESIQELTDVNGDGIKDEITAIYKRL